MAYYSHSEFFRSNKPGLYIKMWYDSQLYSCLFFWHLAPHFIFQWFRWQAEPIWGKMKQFPTGGIDSAGDIK